MAAIRQRPSRLAPHPTNVLRGLLSSASCESTCAPSSVSAVPCGRSRQLPALLQRHSRPHLHDRCSWCGATASRGQSYSAPSRAVCRVFLEPSSAPPCTPLRCAPSLPPSPRMPRHPPSCSLSPMHYSLSCSRSPPSCGDTTHAQADLSTMPPSNAPRGLASLLSPLSWPWRTPSVVATTMVRHACRTRRTRCRGGRHRRRP